MTKQNLQKELLAKVKPGTKPSHLKKLKRSKSADDIPTAPSLPTSTPLTRSQSNQPFTDPQYPYTTLISQQEELEKLQKETTAKSATIALLRKKIEELEQQNPPNALLTDQLTEKQKEIESLRETSQNLRKQLEKQGVYSELSQNKPPEPSELDTALLARHQSLKDWFTQYRQKKVLEKELAENIDEASTELIQQDNLISNLRSQISQLKQTNQSLTKDLDLSNRLAEMRKQSFGAAKDYPYSPANSDYLKYGLYACLAIGLTVWLTNHWKTND